LINLIEINEDALSRDRFDRARNGLVEAESERRRPRPLFMPANLSDLGRPSVRIECRAG